MFSVVSDVTASDTSSSVKISGSFLSLVLAMVFLGGPPAAVIGVVTIAVGWFRWRDEPHFLLNNLVAYAWFPLAGGLAFDAAHGRDRRGPRTAVFYLLVFGTFMVALAVNFLIIAAAPCPPRDGRLDARHGAQARDPGAALRARGGAAGGRASPTST